MTPPWPVPVTSTFASRKPRPPVTFTPLMPKFRTRQSETPHPSQLSNTAP